MTTKTATACGPTPSPTKETAVSYFDQSGRDDVLSGVIDFLHGLGTGRR